MRSAAVARADPGVFVIAIVGAPCVDAAATTDTMSGDAPDWLIPMTSVSAKSGATS